MNQTPVPTHIRAHMGVYVTAVLSLLVGCFTHQFVEDLRRPIAIVEAQGDPPADQSPEPTFSTLHLLEDSGESNTIIAAQGWTPADQSPEPPVVPILKGLRPSPRILLCLTIIGLGLACSIWLDKNELDRKDEECESAENRAFHLGLDMGKKANNKLKTEIRVLEARCKALQDKIDKVCADLRP